MTTAIDVDGVSVSLGGVAVLDAVSTTVEDGQFVGLVGPNGAGKTTLLRTINGALDPDEGAVHVAGADVSDIGSRATSRLVATVPQSTAVAFEFPTSSRWDGRLTSAGSAPGRRRTARPSTRRWSGRPSRTSRIAP